MKTIIAGSRTITGASEVEKAITASGFAITEVISGGAKGVDFLGREWATTNKIPVQYFYPDWKAYGRAAGPIRNGLMAEEAEALIAVYDGSSRGTKDMIRKAQVKGLKVYVHLVNGEKK